MCDTLSICNANVYETASVLHIFTPVEKQSSITLEHSNVMATESKHQRAEGRSMNEKLQTHLAQVEEAGRRYAVAQQSMQQGTVTEVKLQELGDAYRGWVKARSSL